MSEQNSTGTGHPTGTIREAASAFENLMVVTTIPTDRLQAVVETIRPVLRQFGGACLVSDAMWVIH